MDNIRELILADHPLRDHFEAYDHHRTAYLDNLTSILPNRVISKNISLTNKSRIVTTILQRLDKGAFQRLQGGFDLPEVVKAIEILDSNRNIRQLERKRQKLKTQIDNPSRTQKNRLLALERKIDQLRPLSENHPNLSLTSSRTKIVKNWVRSLKRDQLEYRALMFPTEHWRRLADLIHLNPDKDFQLPWFLRFCYGQEAPATSIIGVTNRLTLDNFNQIYSEYPLPYEFIRTKLKFNQNSYNYGDHTKLRLVKEMIANRERAEIVLWYWGELTTPKVDQQLAQRLKEQENIRLSYGKLVDLLMKVPSNTPLFDELVRIAENRLNHYEVTLPQPIVVLGDASASMEVAIKTSGIITSLLCSLARAELRLFRTNDQEIKTPPRTVKQAIEFARTMRACSSTSPASSLYPYYRDRKAVNTFIVVTDEEENTNHNGASNWNSYYGGQSRQSGMMFAELFKKYRQDVAPNSHLIFVTFTNRPNEDGVMVRDLKKNLGENLTSEIVEVYKFDLCNPDLNKMDILLARLSQSN